MSRHVKVVVHYGGQSSIGVNGLQYDMTKIGSVSRMLKLKEKPTYPELVHKIHVALELARDVRVCRIQYKMPMTDQGSIFWSGLDVRSDDEIDAIYECLDEFHGYKIAELIVETETVAIGGSLPVHDLNSQVPIDLNYSQGFASQNFDENVRMLDGDRHNDFVPYNRYEVPVVAGRGATSMGYGVQANEFPSGARDCGLRVESNERPSTSNRICSERQQRVFEQEECANAEVDPRTRGVVDEPTNNEFTEHVGLQDVAEDIADDNQYDDEDVADVDPVSVAHGICNMNLHVHEPIVGETSAAHFNFRTQHHSTVNFEAAEIDLSNDQRLTKWDGVSELGVGCVFSSKEEVQACVKTFSIQRNVSFKVVESRPDYLVLKCIHADDGCKWKMRARKRKNMSLWLLSKYGEPHSCSAPLLNQDHAQLDCQMIVDAIKEMVSIKPDLQVSVVIAAIRSRYNYTISYAKAWYARMKALELIFGGYIESYAKLPIYLNALTHYNPGTVYDFVLEDTHIVNVKQFKRVFWAFKPCIDGFPHCKPVLLIDGTFLTGKFNQTLMIANSVDGNNCLYPVAFAVVEKENISSWTWFMNCIRRYVTQQQGICVVSDRHAGILAVFRDQTGLWREPLCHHRYCLRHFVSNYNTAHRNSTIRNMLYKAGGTCQARKFIRRMNDIKAIDEASYNWAMMQPQNRWCMSEDGGMRYGHATTNIAECCNSMLKGVRLMPITSIVEHVFVRLVKIFDERRTKYRAQLTAGSRFTENVETLMNKRAQKASVHRVIEFDGRTGLFKIVTFMDPRTHKGNNLQIVSLDKRVCSCGKFQGMKLPCSHAIAACLNKNVDMWAYVAKCYTLEESLNCYKTSFQPEEHEEYWPQWCGPQLVPDMALMRKKGRPKTNRIRNEMDERESRRNKPKCSLCRQEGHNKNNCPNRERLPGQCSRS